MRILRIVILGTVLASLVTSGTGRIATVSAQASSYSDTFEGAAINPFWTAVNQNGNVVLSTQKAHTGSQSARFASALGGQRYIELRHTFTAAQKGAFSVWFYDNAPGTETLYEKLLLTNTLSGASAAIGTQDYDAYCYVAGLYTGSVDLGPHAQCGIHPDVYTTNVMRVAAWHNFQAIVGPDTVSFLIDGAQVYSTAGNYSFDTVTLSVSGPNWRPDTVAYFDDFSYVPLDSCPVNTLATLSDQQLAVDRAPASPDPVTGTRAALLDQQSAVDSIAATSSALSGRVADRSRGVGRAPRLDPRAFRSLRDQVMARSQAGRRYTSLYTSHSLEIVRLMLTDSALRASILDGLLLWQADAAAIADGRSGTVTVTADQARAVDAVVDRLAKAGGPALRKAIEDERRMHPPGFSLAQAVLREVGIATRNGQ